MPLFQNYLMVDWSARNVPASGADSIWLAHFRRDESGEITRNVTNPRTRVEAMTLIASIIRTAISLNERIVTGFDFALGYPLGALEIISQKEDYRSLWKIFAERIQDDVGNRSNRFEVAGQINNEFFADKPLYWGQPTGQFFSGLSATKPKHNYEGDIGFRATELAAKGAKSVWQLMGAGCVGSQSMLGMKHLHHLLNHDDIAAHTCVWPLDNGFTHDLSKLSTIVEIYPSLKLFDGRFSDARYKDERQVKSVCDVFCEMDHAGTLQGLFEVPAGLSREDVDRVMRGEGWILGLGSVEKNKPLVLNSNATSYIRSPDAIYAASFAIIRHEANLERFPTGIAHVAERMIHACGMVDLADDLLFSDGAAEVGRVALLNGAPVICDAEMVRHGIIKRLLPQDNQLICIIGDEAVAAHAEEIDNTRSAAQVDLWGDKIGGAIIAIGNAPTALFRLMELIDKGAPKPALILGLPVGFVGAAESKAELAAHTRCVPYITVRGRRGGSAMAAAAVNALSTGWTK